MSLASVTVMVHRPTRSVSLLCDRRSRLLLIINKCNKEDYGTKADASLQIISYPLEGYRRTLRSLLPPGVIN